MKGKGSESYAPIDELLSQRPTASAERETGPLVDETPEFCHQT